MALEISEFVGVRTLAGEVMPLTDGPPVEVHTTNGSKTAGGTTVMLRIKGTGTITWANSKAETFDGVEYRGIQPGATFAVS